MENEQFLFDNTEDEVEDESNITLVFIPRINDINDHNSVPDNGEFNCALVKISKKIYS